MKKTMFLVCTAFAIISCNSATENATTEEKSATVDSDSAATSPAETKQEIVYPYKATYSSDWKMGNPENVVTVLNLYKAVEDNNIDEFDKYLADTVYSQSYDDMNSVNTKEKVIKDIKAMRKNYKTVSEEFLAFVPLHSIDKDEDWVATWMKERVVRNDGTKDSSTYMETWRFKNNKIYYRGGFARDKAFQ